MAQFSFKEVQIFHDRPLGSGAYGAVYRAKCDQLPCAAKILHPMFTATQDPAIRETIDRFRQECEFLSSLKHPHIVQFLGVHTDPSTNQTALLMELMDESLTTFLSRYSLNSPVPLHAQVNICHDVSLALHYLHINGILHRDLSSNNVLLLGGRRAKITDLGVSRIKSAVQKYMTQCPGSPVYMPPEALRVLPEYTEKLDTFSFGVLLIQLITCQFPNPGMHEILVADANSPTGFVSMPVQECDRRAEDIGKIPEGNPLYSLSLKCIEDMPPNRPTSERLCQFFEEFKTSADYTNSINCATPVSEHVTSNITASRPVEQVQKQEDIDSLHLALASKDAEIQQLKENVQYCEDKLTKQTEALQLAETQLADTANYKAEPIPTTPSSYSDRKIIRGLNIDLVDLLSKSHEGEFMGVTYNDPDSGSITVVAAAKESTNNRIKKVLHTYQKMANTPTCLEFVSGPSSSNEALTHGIVDRYNSHFKQCCFRYLPELNLIQLVALNPTVLMHARQQIEHEIAFSILMSCNRRFRLIKRDIVQENVDVLVNAANKHLRLDNGLSGAVNKASNGKIQEYCTGYIKKHGEVQEGSYAMTYGGCGLKCKFILHAVSPDGSKQNHPTCQKMMIELIKKCLEKAESLNAVSIAIPAIGTGHHNIPRKMAANAIITAVLDYDYKKEETLHDIRVVIIDDRTHGEFAEVFKDRKIDYEKSVHPEAQTNTILEQQTSTPQGVCKQQ